MPQATQNAPASNLSKIQALLKSLETDAGITDPFHFSTTEYMPGAAQAVKRTWHIDVRRGSAGKNTVSVGYCVGMGGGGIKCTSATAEELSGAVNADYLLSDYRSLRYSYDTRNMPRPREIHDCGNCPARKLRAQQGEAACGLREQRQ
jgi:hypothetical protein